MAHLPERRGLEPEAAEERGGVQSAGLMTGWSEAAIGSRRTGIGQSPWQFGQDDGGSQFGNAPGCSGAASSRRVVVDLPPGWPRVGFAVGRSLFRAADSVEVANARRARRPARPAARAAGRCWRAGERADRHDFAGYAKHAPVRDPRGPAGGRPAGEDPLARFGRPAWCPRSGASSPQRRGRWRTCPSEPHSGSRGGSIPRGRDRAHRPSPGTRDRGGSRP